MTHSRIEWFWKSNNVPFSKDDRSEWNRYSDIENAIIEEAYQASKSHAMLDDYHLDFQHQVQISNNDTTKQRPTKRLSVNRDNDQLRESRFMSNPIISSVSFHNLIGLQRIFTDTFEEEFDIRSNVAWDNRRTELVTKAMDGILYEGQMAGKQCEGKWIIDQLDKVKTKSKKEIGECCVYLYTLESFLYRILNQTMRLIGDNHHEQLWKSKIQTLGPFAFLLNYYLSFENVTHRTSAEVYRGAQLTEEMIESYRTIAQSKDKRRSFQSFTSCSLDRNKAEQFGNVLFILKPQSRTSFRTLNMNITNLSAYPNEEEVLLRPGRSFEIEKIDQIKEKYIIYLTLISTSDVN